jgi:XTP/dITP diphosphohydrolase
MKKIILATSNKDKVKEIQKYLSSFEVLPYSDIIKPFEIEENGDTFKENAIIKAQAVYEALKSDEYIVLADDSGISVPALGNEPGIYSARYAGINASDKENLNKLIQTLKKNNIKKTSAFYTASIAVIQNGITQTTHGWMWGDVIDEAKGDKGFGYDPMFMPNCFSQTLGELDDGVKQNLSHRIQALNLASCIIQP